MTSRNTLIGTALAVLVAAPLFAQTLGGGASGEGLFTTYCVTCHGAAARGDGPFAASLKVRPADLTQIAARRNGAFPSEEIARIIDGRKPLKGHGSGDMPIWGDAFAKTRDATPVDERIARIVAYLERIQSKTR